MIQHTLSLIGYASGIGGVDVHCGDGPLIIKHSSYLSEIIPLGIPLQWDTIVAPTHSHSTSLRIDESVRQVCQVLAKKVSALILKDQALCVVGGDHTCAIGTWSGVYHALHHQGAIGLIWIDAHMDSHTPETTITGRLHGMPLACLLGYGYPTLTCIFHSAPKLKPENVCLIGVRSFEKGEAALLSRLNVRVFFMDEVRKRGFAGVLREAVALVTKDTVGYGLSLDIDSLDPREAPGVDVPQPDGIFVKDLYDGLSNIVSDPRLIATEIAEFDPSRDQDHLTEKFIVLLLKLIASGKQTTC